MLGLVSGAEGGTWAWDLENWRKFLMISSSSFIRPLGMERGWSELVDGSIISIASEGGRGGGSWARGPWGHVGHEAEFRDLLLHFSQRKHRPRMRRTGFLLKSFFLDFYISRRIVTSVACPICSEIWFWWFWYLFFFDTFEGFFHGELILVIL